MNAFETEKIDGLLQEYFQSEMPQPWPSFAYPRPEVRPARKRTFFRLALAACVALLFLGYLSLAQMFPSPDASGPNGIHQGPTIGKGVRVAPLDSKKPASETPRHLEKITVPTGRF